MFHWRQNSGPAGPLKHWLVLFSCLEVLVDKGKGATDGIYLPGVCVWGQTRPRLVSLPGNTPAGDAFTSALPAPTPLRSQSENWCAKPAFLPFGFIHSWHEGCPKALLLGVPGSEAMMIGSLGYREEAESFLGGWLSAPALLTLGIFPSHILGWANSVQNRGFLAHCRGGLDWILCSEGKPHG